jgi:AcrR family transcriptional regulator
MRAVTRESLSRAAVVQAARELLTSEGLSALSLRRLAAKLDVTAAALYAYVDNKRDLLEAVIETEFQRLIDDFRGYEEAGADPIMRMCQMSWAYVRYARENPRVFRTMFMFRAQLSSEPTGDDFAMATKAFTAARKPVIDAVEQGLVRGSDPVLLHLTVWTAVHGVATVLLLGPDLGSRGAEELAASVIRSVIRGLCTPAGVALIDNVALPPA